MSKIMTIRPPDRLRDDLKTEAAEMGLTLNAYVLQLLWERKKPTERSA